MHSLVVSDKKKELCLKKIFPEAQYWDICITLEVKLVNNLEAFLMYLNDQNTSEYPTDTNILCRQIKTFSIGKWKRNAIRFVIIRRILAT